MTASRYWWLGGLVLTSALIGVWVMARPTQRALPPAHAEQPSGASMRNAGAVGAVSFSPPATEPAPAQRAAALPAGVLEVTVDGHSLVWSKDEIRSVPRAGGTHDLRELVAKFIGDTNLTVTVAGQTIDGAQQTTVNLADLGADDQLRVWPEDDGTWVLARNRTSAEGTATRELYRLTAVTTLSFKRN